MPFASGGSPNIQGLENKVEKLHELLNKKKWWEQTWVQVIALIGSVAGIIGLYSFFK